MFAQLNRIVHLRCYILMVGFAIMSASQALSLEWMIAFCSDRAKHGGNRHIFLMKTDGSEPRNLTADPRSDDYSPAWSPDGRKIAFNSDRDHLFVVGPGQIGDFEIYVMNADGKKRGSAYENRRVESRT